jgi:hypothetical protein
MLDTANFGRLMMARSGTLPDDALCNAFARVGNMLTQIGQPRAPRSISDMSAEDRAVLTKAVELLLKQEQRA